MAERLPGEPDHILGNTFAGLNICVVNACVQKTRILNDLSGSSRSETWVPKRGGLKPAGERQETRILNDLIFMGIPLLASTYACQSETGRIWFRGARFQTPNSVSFFAAHRVPGRELTEFLSADYLCAKANSPSFPQNSPSLPQNSVRLSEFSPPKQYTRNSIRPFPTW